MVEKGRKHVLRALALRFGPEAAAEFTEALNAITDDDKLDELLDLAIKARGINSFRRAFTSAIG